MTLHEKFADDQQRGSNIPSLPRGPASSVSASQSGPLRSYTQPYARCSDHQLSAEARGRGKSTLKATASASGPGSMVSLGVARPRSEFYPWNAMNIHSFNTEVVDVSQRDRGLPKTSERKESTFDLSTSLNYGEAAGAPPLARFFTEHVEFVHDPPYSDWETCMTCGTTSALDIILRMLCNRGAWILAEEYTYSGFLEATRPLDIHVQGVEMDEGGLRPSELDSVLRTWDYSKGPKPSVLYTIPSGQNPTGTTQTAERRRATYNVAEKHDLLILEDDPYYFLHLGECHYQIINEACTSLSVDEYLKRLPPSYLSLDTSGRVLRLDTASKILAPGLRCGWLTASSQLVAKFLAHTDFSTGGPSGPSQLMLYELLVKSWGHEGFLKWLAHLSSGYCHRRDLMLKACERHLPSDICRWQTTTVGMFIWIAVDWRNHPALQCCSSGNEKASITAHGVEDQIYVEAQDRGVQVSKGSWFATTDASSQELFIRLTFAAALEEKLDLAIERFSDALRTVFPHT